MLNWLLLFWRKISAWAIPGQANAVHHDPGSEPYRPSNLHARHYRYNRLVEQGLAASAAFEHRSGGYNCADQRVFGR